MKWFARPALVAMYVFAMTGLADAKQAALTLTIGGKVRAFTSSELLARTDKTDLVIPRDVAYKKRMVYKAVPLLSLLGDASKLTFDTLEARATDGFVSQIPFELVKRGASGGAVAWIAVEPPGKPWPKLPGKAISAGPFFLVWQSPEKSGIGPEQWPYALAALTSVRSPMQRWPQMVVAASLGPKSPARRGMHVFVKQCLSCHRINGAGEANVGPDLGHPMSPTDYMTPIGLRALIRNPASVRTWPKQEMPAFAKDVLSDADLEDLLAYLRHMGSVRKGK